jgi:hypothetical protein
VRAVRIPASSCSLYDYCCRSTDSLLFFPQRARTGTSPTSALPLTSPTSYSPPTSTILSSLSAESAAAVTRTPPTRAAGSTRNPGVSIQPASPSAFDCSVSTIRMQTWSFNASPGWQRSWSKITLCLRGRSHIKLLHTQVRQFLLPHELSLLQLPIDLLLNAAWQAPVLAVAVAAVVE